MNVPEPKLDTRSRKLEGRRSERRERDARISHCIHKTQKDRHRRHARKLNWPPSSATRLSLSLSRAPPTRHYLYKRGRYNGDPLAPPPTVPRDISCCACVFSLLTYSSLTQIAMPRYAHTKKAYARTCRRHAIGILHPPPAHAATSKGNEEGHTKRAVHSKALQRPPFPHRGPHSTRCSRVHSPSLRAPQTRYAPGPGVCAARWSRRSASKRSSSPKDRDGYEHLLSSTWRPSDDWSVYLSGDGENLP